MFTPIPNHVQQALARLLTQYQGATNLQSLLTAIINPIQNIECSLTDMNNLRYLANATGQQLDNIGQIIGLAREAGQSDWPYTFALYAQIKINTSQGQPEQMIQIFALLTMASWIIFMEYFPAEFGFLTTYNPATQDQANSIISVLQTAAPAGVRCDGIITFDPTESFAYDDSSVALGYGDSSDSSVGGMYPILWIPEPPFAYDGPDATGQGYGAILDPLAGGVYAS